MRSSGLLRLASSAEHLQRVVRHLDGRIGGEDFCLCGKHRVEEGRAPATGPYQADAAHSPSSFICCSRS
jgi:hypothetical protein